MTISEIVESVYVMIIFGIGLGLFNSIHYGHANGEPTILDRVKENGSLSENLSEVEKINTPSASHKPIEVVLTAENKERNKKDFIPSDQWQEVKSYHKLPPGLHIRINLQTGLKEAKILSETQDEKQVSVSNVHEFIPTKGEKEASDALPNGHDAIPLSEDLNKKKGLFRENIIEALKNIKNEDAETEEVITDEGKKKTKKKPKFRSYDDLKMQFQELNLNVESESEIMNRLIKEYQGANDEVRITILEDMDFLIHQIDVAVNFINMGGLQKIIEPGLNSTNEEVRKGVMRLLGSASQSNPKVQIAALEEGLLNQLLRIVARETDVAISAKAVFAVSCLVRGFPYGQRRLVESGGLHTLREVFLRDDWQSLTLQLKVVSLIQDLLAERESAEGDRLTQLQQLNLGKWLVEGEWCSAVLSLLNGVSFDRRGKRDDLSAALGREIPLRPDHDTVDKVVSAMVHLAPSCDNSFFPSLPLLRSLKETYSDLAYKETFQGDDGHEFFQGLANQIEGLVMKISRKQEL